MVALDSTDRAFRGYAWFSTSYGGECRYKTLRYIQDHAASDDRKKAPEKSHFGDLLKQRNRLLRR